MSEYLIVLLNSFSCCGTALCTNSVKCPYGDISMQLTNHNRAGQLTNQSRLGSGFRQRVKRGDAAQAV